MKKFLQTWLGIWEMHRGNIVIHKDLGRRIDEKLDRKCYVECYNCGALIANLKLRKLPLKISDRYRNEFSSQSFCMHCEPLILETLKREVEQIKLTK